MDLRTVLLPVAVLFGIFLMSSVAARTEGNKWVWGENGEKNERNARYQVYEQPIVRPLVNVHNQQYGSAPSRYPGPYGPESGPIQAGPVHSGSTQVLVGPEGPTGLIGRPVTDYKPAPESVIAPGVNVDPVTVNSVPVWIKQDYRYRDYDTCKCSYGFNCPGLKFGSCAKGKQYCCYDSRRIHKTAAATNYENHNGPLRPHSSALPFEPFDTVPSDYYESHSGYGQLQQQHQQHHHHHHQTPHSTDYDSPTYNRPYKYDWQQRPYGSYGTYDVTGYARSAGKSVESTKKEK